MKKVWDACVAADVPIPEAVLAFFGNEEPDQSGVIVAVQKTEWGDDHRSGYEVDLSKIPGHVKFLRFYNSW